MIKMANQVSSVSFDNKLLIRKSLHIEDITRWREDMNFIFEWHNNI